MRTALQTSARVRQPCGAWTRGRREPPSPRLRGEGWGEGQQGAPAYQLVPLMWARTRRKCIIQRPSLRGFPLRPPLTLTLSPQERGEGTRAAFDLMLRFIPGGSDTSANAALAP
jgi:hypothetical protein